MMDILFKSSIGIASVFTLGFLLVMAVGLTWWLKRKMDNPNEE